MEVAHVDDVFDGIVAEFVGLAVAEAGLHSASGHPHGETFDVVVATGTAFALEHGCSSEFATPNHEGVLEKSTLFEIGEKGPGGFVGVAAADLHVFVETAMVVPTTVVKLDEAGAFFNEASREKAV